MLSFIRAVVVTVSIYKNRNLNQDGSHSSSNQLCPGRLGVRTSPGFLAWSVLFQVLPIWCFCLSFYLFLQFYYYIIFQKSTSMQVYNVYIKHVPSLSHPAPPFLSLPLLVSHTLPFPFLLLPLLVSHTLPPPLPVPSPIHRNSFSLTLILFTYITI